MLPEPAFATAPHFELTPDECFALHWNHLKNNDEVHVDAGLEARALHRPRHLPRHPRPAPRGLQPRLHRGRRFRRCTVPRYHTPASTTAPVSSSQFKTMSVWELC